MNARIILAVFSLALALIVAVMVGKAVQAATERVSCPVSEATTLQSTPTGWNTTCDNK